MKSNTPLIDVDHKKFIYEFCYSGNPILDCIILNFNEKNMLSIIDQYGDISLWDALVGIGVTNSTSPL